MLKNANNFTIKGKNRIKIKTKNSRGGASAASTFFHLCARVLFWTCSLIPPPSALLQHKENFKEMDAAESQRLNRGQKDRLDYEVRKFRRRRLVKYHDLEQDLLREVNRGKLDLER